MQLAVSLVDWKDSTAIFTTAWPLIRIFDAPRQSASSLKEIIERTYNSAQIFYQSILRCSIVSLIHVLTIEVLLLYHIVAVIMTQLKKKKRTMIILEEKLSKIFKEIFASHLRATIKAEDTVILARAFICGATKQPRE